MSSQQHDNIPLEVESANKQRNFIRIKKPFDLAGETVGVALHFLHAFT